MGHYKVLVFGQVYIRYICGQTQFCCNVMSVIKMLFWIVVEHPIVTKLKTSHFSGECLFLQEINFFYGVLLHESVSMLLWFITLFSYSHNICANMYVCVFILDICLMEKPIELQESIQYCSNLLVLLCLTTRPQGQLNKSVLFSCSSLRFKIERGSWKQN